jgi:hypothetical protein
MLISPATSTGTAHRIDRRRPVPASGAGATGMHGSAPQVAGATAHRRRAQENTGGVLHRVSSSRQAGQEALKRMTPGPRTGHRHDLRHPRSAVRRGQHLVHPRPRAAPAADRPAHTGSRGQRQQRPDGSCRTPPTFSPAGRPAASAGSSCNQAGTGGQPIGQARGTPSSRGRPPALIVIRQLVQSKRSSPSSGMSSWLSPGG